MRSCLFRAAYTSGNRKKWVLMVEPGIQTDGITGAGLTSGFCSGSSASTFTVAVTPHDLPCDAPWIPRLFGAGGDAIPLPRLTHGTHLLFPGHVHGSHNLHLSTNHKTMITYILVFVLGFLVSCYINEKTNA